MMSNLNDISDTSTRTEWKGLGSTCSKELVVYIAQVLLVYIIVITSILNLTVNQDTQSESSNRLWTSLLASSVGYLLPNPKLTTK